MNARSLIPISLVKKPVAVRSRKSVKNAIPAEYAVACFSSSFSGTTVGGPIVPVCVGVGGGGGSFSGWPTPAAPICAAGSRCPMSGRWLGSSFGG